MYLILHFYCFRNINFSSLNKWECLNQMWVLMREKRLDTTLSLHEIRIEKYVCKYVIKDDDLLSNLHQYFHCNLSVLFPGRTFQCVEFEET